MVTPEKENITPKLPCFGFCSLNEENRREERLVELIVVEQEWDGLVLITYL